MDLTEKCSVHRQILSDLDAGRTDLISGELYRVDPGYTTTSLHMFAALGLDEQIKARSFSDESVEVSTSAINESQTFSFNIGIWEVEEESDW